MNNITFTINGVPPSTNHLYFNLPTGGRALNKIGKKYAGDIKDLIGREYFEQMSEFKVDDKTMFKVSSIIYFKTLRNGPTAKGYYKQIDVDNRIKLLHDVVFKSIGVDDRNIFNISVMKKESNDERVEITLEVIDNSEGYLK
jgi:Holliday junction resolvase RusA-like endonuclease